MEIRDAVPEDASAACEVLRRSISELCGADHRNDPEILTRWLANKTVEIVGSWIIKPAPQGKFGTTSSYPMSKRLTGQAGDRGPTVVQDARTGGVPPVRLQRVVDELPADFDTIRGEARVEGHQFLDRLANDWVSGVMRFFDRPGEALLAAYSNGVLAAVGGITVDPVVPGALRMRRFYVRPSFRKAGIGRQIAQALLERALQSVRVVTLNAAIDSVPFWEALGFVPEARHGHTHVHCQAEPHQ